MSKRSTPYYVQREAQATVTKLMLRQGVCRNRPPHARGGQPGRAWYHYWRRAGDEIVQLYVRDRVGEVTRPVKESKGFQRTCLAPGEEKCVRFALPVRELGFHGLEMTYKVEPGEFDVWIGPDSSRGLQGSFSVH